MSGTCSQSSGSISQECGHDLKPEVHCFPSQACVKGLSVAEPPWKIHPEDLLFGAPDFSDTCAKVALLSFSMTHMLISSKAAAGALPATSATMWSAAASA